MFFLISALKFLAKCDLVCVKLKMMNKLVPNVLHNQFFPPCYLTCFTGQRLVGVAGGIMYSSCNWRTDSGSMSSWPLATLNHFFIYTRRACRPISNTSDLLLNSAIFVWFIDPTGRRLFRLLTVSLTSGPAIWLECNYSSMISLCLNKMLLYRSHIFQQSPL